MCNENKDEKEPGLLNRRDSTGCLFRGFLFLLLPILAIVVLCSLCTRGCSSDSYDRWDYLEHKVKSDPYYKQWESLKTFGECCITSYN